MSAPCFACLVHVPDAAPRQPEAEALLAIADQFSPRWRREGDDMVLVDLTGLQRLLGSPSVIAHEIARTARERGVRIHLAIASTCTAARILARTTDGITVVPPGQERHVLGQAGLASLAGLARSAWGPREESESSSAAARASGGGAPRAVMKDGREGRERREGIQTFTRWGLRTLGDIAALPPDELAARMGAAGARWQALARGEDLEPFVPDVPDEPFEASCELEWPVEDLEPLSFVLTRLLEPLSAKLEARDRGVAVLHVTLHLVTREVHARRLELPAPIRDVRSLRTLALLDLDAHPPTAAVDRVSLHIEPTPGRVLQHTLFSRAQPAPEAITTLVARLNALMGQDRVGAPTMIDSHRPGAFTMTGWAGEAGEAGKAGGKNLQSPSSLSRLVLAWRRCRHPVPARVAVDADHPIRVTTDRRAYPGGRVVECTGPWRSSGSWWESPQGQPETESLRSRPRAAIAAWGASGGGGPAVTPRGRESTLEAEGRDRIVQSERGWGPASSKKDGPWNHDEWDVALTDGAVYRLVHVRDTGGWFIAAIRD